jgi:hypothetical protein
LGGFVGVHEVGNPFNLWTELNNSKSFPQFVWEVLTHVWSDPWLVFTRSWLLDSVSFNLTQVAGWGWGTTPIQATSALSKGLIVAFSFVSDVILIGGYVNAIQGRAEGVQDVLP